jgi:hypothetical protein
MNRPHSYIWYFVRFIAYRPGKSKLLISATGARRRAASITVKLDPAGTKSSRERRHGADDALRNLYKIQRAFEAAGIVFLDAADVRTGGVGLRLRC